MLSASRVMASMLQDFQGVLPVDYLATENIITGYYSSPHNSYEISPG